MAYQLISAPAEEPVSLADARAFLQIDADITDDDALIELVLIPTARAAAEHLTGRSLVTQTWRRTLDAFPCVIDLERGPLQSVTSIQHRDADGSMQTVDTAVYRVDAAGWRVATRFGEVWPLPAAEIGAVQVDFVTGYGDAEAVPEAFKHWILMRIKSLWEYRSEDVEVLRGQLSKPSFVDRLLDGYTTIGA